MTDQLPFSLTPDPEPSPRQKAPATRTPASAPRASESSRASEASRDSVSPTTRSPGEAVPAPPAATAQPEPAAAQRKVYTVTKLNREVRLLLERGIPLIWLEGELSNFSSPGSGANATARMTLEHGYTKPAGGCSSEDPSLGPTA